MTIAIIGATGNFGTDIIDSLLTRNTDPASILALGRDETTLAPLAERGLQTATIDLTNEEATAQTLTGVDTLLLISIGAPGEGLAVRTAAANAAKAAGVSHLIYTSALYAPTTTFVLAAEHKATEEVITASGIPATFLRAGWYTDNMQQDFESARTRGVIANSVADGRLATAPRSDMAEAVAIVLTTPGHEGKAYELSGDTAWNYSEFVEAASSVIGAPVTYQALSPEQEREMLLGAGLDEYTVSFIGMMNAGMRENTQAPTPGDLAQLLGRPTTPLANTLATWMQHPQ